MCRNSHLLFGQVCFRFLIVTRSGLRLGVIFVQRRLTSSRLMDPCVLHNAGFLCVLDGRCHPSITWSEPPSQVHDARNGGEEGSHQIRTDFLSGMGLLDLVGTHSWHDAAAERHQRRQRRRLNFFLFQCDFKLHDPLSRSRPSWSAAICCHKRTARTARRRWFVVACIVDLFDRIPGLLQDNELRGVL